MLVKYTDIKTHKDIIYIPIGNQCEPAHYLRSKGLRKCAFPFDWCTIPLANVIELIDNDFNKYDLIKDNLIIGNLQLDNMIFNDLGRPRKRSTYQVYYKKYNIFFPHDYTALTDEKFNELNQKYKRRIDRLLQILAGDNPICFVYHKYYTYNINNNYKHNIGYNPLDITEDDNKKYIKNFKDMINVKYPELVYAIVTIPWLNDI